MNQQNNVQPAANEHPKPTKKKSIRFTFSRLTRSSLTFPLLHSAIVFINVWKQSAAAICYLLTHNNNNNNNNDNLMITINDTNETHAENKWKYSKVNAKLDMTKSEICNICST